MSESLSSRTKTLSETVDSESTEEQLITDRWSNNITYRQLVMSSCVGIVQVWWHPYVHDFRKHVPFLFLYNVFSVFFVYPSFYLELALGAVTKKGVFNCWDMMPMARGVGFAMIMSCTFLALCLGAASAWCLALLVHSFHSFLPWLHCASSAQPACAARHRPLPKGSETPAQSFFFNFVLHLKRNGLEGGFGDVVPELTVYYVISWILVYFVACKRIYSYSKLVLFKDIMAFFVLVTSAIGVTNLKGASRIFNECDWSVLLDGLPIWREALEYSFIQMAVSQGTLIMLGSYCPKQKHVLANTSMFAFAVSKISCTASALILGAAHGALYRDYDNDTNIWKGPSSSIILWADFAARIPGSQFWSALIFFTFYVLSIASTALLVQTIMSTFTGRSIRKISWAFLILITMLFCLIGVITLATQVLYRLLPISWVLLASCLLHIASPKYSLRLSSRNISGGMYILNFLMTWPISKPRTPIVAVVAAVVTYVFGQTTFCEHVCLIVGEYPCVFFRISWALTPIILMATFLSGLSHWPSEALAGWSLVMTTLLPMAVFAFLYLVFKFRVRNIVGNEK